MSIDAIAALVFVVFLAIFLWLKRSKVELQKALFPFLYVVMYRSKLGLKTMDVWAKRMPHLLKWAGYIGIALGFIGMVLIAFELIFNTIKLFTIEQTMPGIQPVLPIEAKGVFFVPFLYWIISIFAIAVVHEFAHGVIARVHNIPVKNSGFAFVCAILPIIPAAFVEPNENDLKKRSQRVQLSVFAAGPVSNFLFALVCIGMLALLSPVMSAAYHSVGLEVAEVTVDSPAEKAGLQKGDVMTNINGVSVISSANLTHLLESLKPSQKVTIETLNESKVVTLASISDNESRAFMGVKVLPHAVPVERFSQTYGSYLPPFIKWTTGLFVWLFMLNIGIGLFNLLPIGPLDGGRMFQLVCLRFFKEKTALKVWSRVSLFFVLLILANLFAGIF